MGVFGLVAGNIHKPQAEGLSKARPLNAHQPDETGYERGAIRTHDLVLRRHLLYPS